MKEQPTHDNPPFQSETGEGEEFSLIELFWKYIRYWKWIVAGVAVALMAAAGYLYYATPVYKVSARVILKDVQSAQKTPTIGAIDELTLLVAVNNVEDETFVMKSQSVLQAVVDRLDLHTSYIVEGRIKNTDLYTKSPVIVAMEKSELDNLKQNIDLEMAMLSDGSIAVKGITPGLPSDTVFKNLPALLHTSYGNISFTRREGVEPDYRLLYISIRKPETVIDAYLADLDIQQANRQSSVLNLSFNTPYIEKGKDFLNTLIEEYNNQAIEDKNMEALNTQKFINERIVIIDRELSAAEQNVEEYKRSQGLTDLQADLARTMQMSSRYEQQLVEVESQLSIVKLLRDYVNNPANADKTIPVNIGIDDPMLNAAISEYNRLLLQRQRLTQSVTPDNPVMRKLEDEIAGLRTAINSSINSVLQGLTTKQKDLFNQASLYSGKIGSMPTQEREFLDLSREQQIKANLFLMLLQKREENALALAAVANKAKVLNKAKTVGKIYPRTTLVLAVALVLGLLLPGAVIYAVSLFRYRIESRADVEKIATVPLLAEIPRHEEEGDNENIAIKKDDRSSIAEAFRMLRTSLMLALGGDKKAVVFTSTVPGEGKTFVAINTALSFALLDKKVLIMELDLRLSRIRQYFHIGVKEGISNYLSGMESDIDKLVVPSGIHENLFVLPSGPIPPNPAELLSRDMLDKAMEHLREKYDYIFIDSPPVNQVADTLIINRVSDATVYVCRAGYSSKNLLRFANELMEQGKLKNMLLVVNDVKDLHHYDYRYGHGYPRQYYKYGYGNDKAKKKHRKL
ncbi:GumC family protein [Anaerorudis cellulosivorans]|uniref:GumC family protein n=1 Tax=Anaerorudis cellulosivorans TaxID=3397862 RepID=UPI00221EDC24|nr:polysaccharide biosynthesis tyrosine autokinase [Seramator thermalis]MCW1735301.1 polysaccharide biosynthesis tyrosine autokinase [Seramator thermalis]